MSNNENLIFGGVLLGLSLVLGAAAAAMEPDKNGSTVHSSVPPSLPAFFDGTRFPNLQDMWKFGVSDPAAEEADRPADTVRERAEKLSQHFGDGAKTATPTQGDVSEITTSALPEDPASAQSDPAATIAPKPVKANKPAASIGVETAVPAPKVKQAAIPPRPVRAPRIARVRKTLLSPKSRTGAVPRSGTPASPAAKRSRPPVSNSFNGEKSIGDMIAEAMQKVGGFVGL